MKIKGTLSQIFGVLSEDEAKSLIGLPVSIGSQDGGKIISVDVGNDIFVIETPCGMFLLGSDVRSQSFSISEK